MRNEDVGRKSAIDRDAEMTMIGAQVLFSRDTRRAGTAPDPRINRHAMADGRVLGLFACALDDSGDLVPEREWQRAAGGHVEFFVATQREIAVLQVQVGMAYAATFDAHQHFAAARRGAVHDGLAERLSVGNERLAMHFSHWDPPAASGVGIMPESGDVRRGPAPAMQIRQSGYLRRAPSGLARRSRAAPEHRHQANAGFDAASCAAGRMRPGLRFRGACDRKASGCVRGTRRTSEEVTFGGGTNADGLTSKRIRASQRHCASTESRP